MRIATKSICSLAVLLSAHAPAAFTQAPAKFAKLTIEQLIDIKHPSDPLWSPDGKHVVFHKRLTVDRAALTKTFTSNPNYELNLTATMLPAFSSDTPPLTHGTLWISGTIGDAFEIMLNGEAIKLYPNAYFTRISRTTQTTHASPCHYPTRGNL